MNDQNQFLNTNRRVFLKAAGAVASALFLSGFDLFSERATSGDSGLMYEGNSKGQVLEYQNGGQTWQVVADFGENCWVNKVKYGPSGLVAKISHQKFKFDLKSTDGRTWYSMDWVDPSSNSFKRRQS